MSKVGLDQFKVTLTLESAKCISEVKIGFICMDKSWSDFERVQLLIKSLELNSRNIYVRELCFFLCEFISVHIFDESDFWHSL